jgi:hypothetical protein
VINNKCISSLLSIPFVFHQYCLTCQTKKIFCCQRGKIFINTTELQKVFITVAKNCPVNTGKCPTLTMAKNEKEEEGSGLKLVFRLNRDKADSKWTVSERIPESTAPISSGFKIKINTNLHKKTHLESVTHVEETTDSVEPTSNKRKASSSLQVLSGSTAQSPKKQRIENEESTDETVGLSQPSDSTSSPKKKQKKKRKLFFSNRPHPSCMYISLVTVLNILLSSKIKC